MRVIKPGRVSQGETHKKCGKCGGEFIYGFEDILADRESTYINCPCCKAFIWVDVKIYSEKE